MIAVIGFITRRISISPASALIRLYCFDVRLHDETRFSVDVKDVGGRRAAGPN